MPFIKLECTATVLAKLRLPDKLDDTHPYHYLIWEHSDGEAILVSQEYQHRAESFHTQVLIIGQQHFLVVTKWEKVHKLWNLAAISIFANALDQDISRSKLIAYLEDMVAAFRDGSSDMWTFENVTLAVREHTSQTTTDLGRFINGCYRPLVSAGKTAAT